MQAAANERLWRSCGESFHVRLAFLLDILNLANLRFLFSSSFIASLGSAVASTPIDVIRVGDMEQENALVITNPHFTQSVSRHV